MNYNMKNKMMILVLMVAVVLVATGCSKKTEDVPNDSEIVDKPIIDELDSEEETGLSKDKTEEPTLDYNAITLAVESENIFIYNISPEEGTIYQTGMPYYVDSLNEGGEWEQVDLGLMFTMQIVIVDSENPFTQIIDLTGVEPGKYRISKSILNVEGDAIESIGSFDVTIREVTK